MHTRSGQGSRNDDQGPNRVPPIQIRRAEAVEEGNSRGNANPPPLTLEGSRTLLEKNVKSKTPENITQTQSSSREAPPSPPRKIAKEGMFKDFMSCRPKEFNGEMDPKVTVSWISETEQILRICRCSEDLKVEFASQMLKANALTWWSTLDRTLGSEVVSSFTWEEFTKRLKGKFCSARHREKLVDEIFALSKDKQTIDEYTKKFCDMLPFLEDTLPTEAGRINRYANGLPSDYALEVGKASTLDEALEAAARVESMLEKRAKERHGFGEKRNQSSPSGSCKKSRFSSGSSKREELKECKRCGKHHSVECKKGTNNYFKCGQFGHKAKECRSKDARETLVSTASNKNTKPTKVKGRAFQMTREEAKETHHVVAGTLLVNSLLVNSLPAYVLFDSGANLSFVSHEFRKCLSVSVKPLEDACVIEIANGELVTVRHVYENCPIEINGRILMANLLPIGIKGFDVVIGMDSLGAHEAKILCGKRVVSIKSPDGNKMYVYGERRNNMQSIISAVKARKCIYKGCDSFIAYVLDGKKEK
ncbi:hypothetical protein L2E82_48797 [Cichorium intybus]|uniref:Uncharacterized protein n=1 Tax=Cichorium intybus TaxID=13427 RepID=A0ACB8Z300_CICIN|nr:hypothetical protein L2E82_48797 [Cichorium intybus]